jgi:hypothetical protein
LKLRVGKRWQLASLKNVNGDLGRVLGSLSADIAQIFEKTCFPLKLIFQL